MFTWNISEHRASLNSIDCNDERDRLRGLSLFACVLDLRAGSPRTGGAADDTIAARPGADAWVRSNAELTPTRPDIDEAFQGSCFPADEVRASARIHAPDGRSLLLSRVFLAARSVGADSAALTRSPSLQRRCGRRFRCIVSGGGDKRFLFEVTVRFSWAGRIKRISHQPESHAGRYGANGI
jgi:hypothetical protein